MTTISTPDAAVIVYNYIDRMGTNSITQTTVKNQLYTEINISKFIVSISTTKSKESPTGTFTITLAPTINWLSKLTSGSWLTIYMSSSKLKYDDSGFDFKSNSKYIKMIGRIDTVRVKYEKDQSNHALRTIYEVSGRDWGQIFETNILIHSLASTAATDNVRLAEQLSLIESGLKDASKVQYILSSTQAVKMMMSIFSSETIMTQYKSSGEKFAGQKPDLRLFPKSHYRLPEALSDLIFTQNNENENIFDMLDIVSGVLVGEDSYQDKLESYTLVDFTTLIGTPNTLWQIMHSEHNNILNEMFCDITFYGDKPALCLYKRVKPFQLNNANSSNSPTKKISPTVYPTISSSFFDLYKTTIPQHNIISIEAGTNWMDKVNLIELVFDPVYATDLRYADVSKIQSVEELVIFDRTGAEFEREGFRPMSMPMYFFPLKDNKPDPLGAKNWTYMLAEWYFNIHKMLNGNITIINTDDTDKHIEVGSNIMFNSKAFYNTTFSANQQKKEHSNMLAHVETVNHNFSVNQSNGAKNFTTTILFVRGVFVDEVGAKLIDPEEFGIPTLTEKEDTKIAHKNTIIG
jgi:hypothetical protein